MYNEQTISGRWWKDTLKEMKAGKSPWNVPPPSASMDLLTLTANANKLDEQIAHWNDEMLNSDKKSLIVTLGKIVEMQSAMYDLYQKEIAARGGVDNSTTPQTTTNPGSGSTNQGTGAGQPTTATEPTGPGKNNLIIWAAAAAAIYFILKK